MRTFILHFIHDEGGQDLIEYTLLMACLTLGSAAIYASVGASLTLTILVNEGWHSGTPVLGREENIKTQGQLSDLLAA